jgi:A/G-specific adenine glycosylase
MSAGETLISTAAKSHFIRSSLLRWYDKKARSFPWRSKPSPYRVWVAEIMAQQTRLDTVEPYFRRFVRRFPSLRSLANAEVDEVLALWSGLGYYSRARNLHAAAILVSKNHKGRLPETVPELLTLPGIGRYTAGAIASIAFQVPAPIVDGNVIRVLTRLFDIDQDADASQVRKVLWDLAERLVPKSRPGDFNQALMELGATVCRPLGPQCGPCPVRRICRAYANGTTEERPVRTAKKPPKPIHVRGALIRDKAGRFLLVQRKHDGVFGGLWTLPMEPEALDGSANGGLKAFRSNLESRLETPITPVGKLGRFIHVLSHRRITFELHEYRAAALNRTPDSYLAHLWIETEEALASLALPGFTRKALALAGIELPPQS